MAITTTQAIAINTFNKLSKIASSGAVQSCRQAMNPIGTVKVWRGGEHRFALPIGAMRALEKARDAGANFILTRFVTGQWFVDDVYEVVRLGLVGGGMDEKEARKLADENVGYGRYFEHVPLATELLKDALMGDEDDPAGELVAGADQSKTHSREEKPDGQTSTDGPE